MTADLDCIACGRMQPCREHGCHECGGFILADTEDWTLSVCFECWEALGHPATEPDWTKVCLVASADGDAPPRKPWPISQTVAWAESPCPTCKGRMGDHLIRAAGAPFVCPDWRAFA